MINKIVTLLSHRAISMHIHEMSSEVCKIFAEIGKKRTLLCGQNCSLCCTKSNCQVCYIKIR